ncbi:response regulator [Candidatus Pacearchaeota archaeon]|nr:response regulator [Candidatus Pacearchaeota archaeon]
MIDRIQYVDRSLYREPLILLAEDHEDSRKGLYKLLQLELPEATIHEVENGLDLVKKVQANRYRYGIIISDLNMPIMNGDKALMKVRELNPNIISCVYTALRNDEAMRNIHEAGVKNIFFKPDPFPLLDFVQETYKKVLEARSSYREKIAV